MHVMEFVRERARAKCPYIVFAEGDNSTVAEAAAKTRDAGIAKPILLGSKDVIGSHGIDLTGITVIDMATQADKIKSYAAAYETRTDFPAGAVEPMLAEPVNFAAMMLAEGDADGMVAGFVYTTEDVINSSQMFVGLADGVATASSYVIMDVPGWQGGESGLTVFGDCSMVPVTTSEELAAVAMNTAASVKRLLEWEPRVALISFSTKGSAKHADIDKVTKAIEIVRQAQPDLCIDGEMQIDAAIVPAVSAKKIRGENKLHGNANILIFPNLDAGNAACKLVQNYAKANMYGAVMCGFAKPLTELSRGMKVDDIVGATAIVAAQV